MAVGSEPAGVICLGIRTSRTARATWLPDRRTKSCARHKTRAEKSSRQRPLYSAGLDPDDPVPLPDLATSSRSHLRWCRQAQPPVTRPRVMAGMVPRTQMAE